jgi:hypothetical protein
MEYTEHLNFVCPHCEVRVEASIIVVIGKSYDVRASTTTVGYKDILPIKCEKCGNFVQVEVASLVFGYEVAPVQLT